MNLNHGLLQAANNLTVLSREEGACQIIIQQGGLDKLKTLLFGKEDPVILQAGVRVLGSLTQGSKIRVSMGQKCKIHDSGFYPASRKHVMYTPLNPTFI